MDPKTKRANEDQRATTQGLFHNIHHTPKTSYRVRVCVTLSLESFVSYMCINIQTRKTSFLLYYSWNNGLFNLWNYFFFFD